MAFPASQPALCCRDLCITVKTTLIKRREGRQVGVWFDRYDAKLSLYWTCCPSASPPRQSISRCRRHRRWSIMWLVEFWDIRVSWELLCYKLIPDSQSVLQLEDAETQNRLLPLPYLLHTHLLHSDCVWTKYQRHNHHDLVNLIINLINFFNEMGLLVKFLDDYRGADPYGTWQHLSDYPCVR